MRFFTWCGPYARHKTALLIASGTRLGIQITPILCYGLMDKIQSLWQRTQTLEESAIVICMDGYDCLFLRDFQDTIQRVRVDPRKVIFSCQNSSEHHFHSTIGINNPFTNGLAWINSGVIFGTAGSLRRMLEEILSWNTKSLEDEFRRNSPYGDFNDQTLFGRFLQLNPDKALLDMQYVLSKTSAYENLGQLTTAVCSERILQLTEEGPAILHLPFTSPTTYYRYLEIANFILGRDLRLNEMDLIRLARLSSLETGLPKCLSNIRKRPLYLFEFIRQSCLSSFARTRRKLRNLGFLELKKFT